LKNLLGVGCERKKSADDHKPGQKGLVQSEMTPLGGRVVRRGESWLRSLPLAWIIGGGKASTTFTNPSLEEKASVFEKRGDNVPGEDGARIWPRRQ